MAEVVLAADGTGDSDIVGELVAGLDDVQGGAGMDVPQVPGSPGALTEMGLNTTTNGAASENGTFRDEVRENADVGSDSGTENGLDPQKTDAMVVDMVSELDAAIDSEDSGVENQLNAQAPSSAGSDTEMQLSPTAPGFAEAPSLSNPGPALAPSSASQGTAIRLYCTPGPAVSAQLAFGF